MTGEEIVRANNPDLDVLDKVDALVQQLAAAEILLEHGYARLGYLLSEVSEQGYWRDEYQSFGEYIDAVAEKFNRGRTQIYHYFSTVKALRGSVSENDLNTMGITKAKVLADAIKVNGTLPENIMADALNSERTAKDLEKTVAVTLHKPEHEDSEWLDLKFAFFVTAEEKATIQDAVSAARHLEPEINTEMKDHMQKKEIVMRWAQEFLASYAQDHNMAGYPEEIIEDAEIEQKEDVQKADTAMQLEDEQII